MVLDMMHVTPVARPAFPRRFAYPAAVLACLATSSLGAWITRPAIPGWYAGLAKPVFNPPDAVFPIVWPILFAMMAVAVARVATRPEGTPMLRPALALFATQLVLNVSWSFAFFGRHSPAAGMLTVVFLLASIAATTAVFFRIDRPAGALMVPYLAWVSFATILNGAILALN